MADINFLEGISLGKITSWNGDKESAITPIPFPGEDSSSTEGVDTLGTIKFIKFGGRLTGSDQGIELGNVSPFSLIQDRIQLIENIIDGYQTAGFKLYSPFVVGVEYDAESAGNKRRVQGNIGVVSSVLELPNLLRDTKGLFVIRGIKTGDKVKNLITKEVADVVDVINNETLSLSKDLFKSVADGGTGPNTPYAVTANIYVKLMKFSTNWELPGLSFCDYTLEVMQVRK